MRTAMRSLLALVLLCSPAFADKPRFELGVALGGHAFSDSVELGVTDHMAEPGPASSGLLGVRIAKPFTNRIAVEGEGMWIPTEDDVLQDAVVIHLRNDHRPCLITIGDPCRSPCGSLDSSEPSDAR